VTTSQVAALRIGNATSIPTGVEESEIVVEDVAAFRAQYHIKPEEILAGTVCFVRSWKGVNDLMEAARLAPMIRWIVIGGGYYKDYEAKAEALGITNLIFTGHLDNPYTAIAALDIFLLLSTAHEGVSQASLQAAYLRRPLVTTPVGGLPEVCLEGETGFIVPSFSPERVRDAVARLAEDSTLRQKFGNAAHALVVEKFTFNKTLDQMEQIYSEIPKIS